jgi:small subunit ribosomal protein S4
VPPDNVLVRLGFASSHAQARQFVRHGHVLVNGKKVNIPSHQAAAGNEISFKDKMQQNVHVAGAMELVSGVNLHWLEMNSENVSGKTSACRSAKISICRIQERMIVELYSK